MKKRKLGETKKADDDLGQNSYAYLGPTRYAYPGPTSYVYLGQTTFGYVTDTADTRSCPYVLIKDNNLMKPTTTWSGLILRNL